MSSKFLILLKYDCNNLNIRYRLLQNLLSLFIISSISMPMITDISRISAMAPLFIITSLPVLILSMCGKLFHDDAENGILDFCIIHYGVLCIALSKFIAISGFCVIITLIAMPIFSLFFNLSNLELMLLLSACLIISIYTCALCVLVSSMEHYFVKSQVLIASIILPLLIPQIILCGIIIENQSLQLIFLAFGVCLIISSIAILFASMLVKNQ